MSTYIISDIHGQIDAFKKMLDKIEFKLDGTDSLHILGDMIDWGDQSIETLQYVMELNDKHHFVHVYKGNHEDMMQRVYPLDQDKDSDFGAEIMWARNGGTPTMNGLEKLDKPTQTELLKFLDNIPYVNRNLVVNNQSYYLSHAGPFVTEYTIPTETDIDSALWERHEKYDNPIYLLEKPDLYKDHIFISGHTITHYYDSYTEDGYLKIFKDLDNQKIIIDCGAKILGKQHGFGLACLRLDDMKEFYIY